MSQDSTRRNLLKTAIAGGAALAVAPALPASAAAKIRDQFKKSGDAARKMTPEKELLMRYAGEFGPSSNKF